MKKYGLSSKDKTSQVKLNKLNVSGNICGEYVEYTISQYFRNTTGENIEGTYSFPVPTTSILTGFEVELGGRNLKAEVESRDEVLKIQEEAHQGGINSITLEQSGDDYFTIRIGNILPNEKVVIRITYMDQLIYEDNSLKLMIPRVVDPVYNDGEADEEGETEFYLSLLIESFGKLDIKSPSHKIKVEREDDTLSKVTAGNDQNLDHDFILNLKELKPLSASGMGYSYYEDEEEKAILMLRLTPRLPEVKEIKDTNYDFLLDISTSMNGFKLEEAKNSIIIALRSLEEGDTFNIMAFNSELYKFSPHGKVRYSKENLLAATEWIEALQTKKGGLAMFDALKESLRESEEDEASVIFLFTDDFVENEDEILDYVRSNIGNSMIFPFGMDTEVNSFFINKLAELGYGKPEFIDEGERIDDIILRQINRIYNPQFDVTSIDWGEMQVEKTYPGTISYLYDREPFTIFAKVNGYIEGKVTLKGEVDGEDYTMTIDLDKLEIEENSKLIDKVWARKRIESLIERERTMRGHEAEKIREEILCISKEYSLMSSETSFIMLEKIEDPVLGIGLHRMVPIEMSENTMKSMAKGYFLDEAAYSFEVNIREKMAETGLTAKEAKNAIKYDRDNLLRVLAKNQQADGSFLDLGEEDDSVILETTLRSLLAFTVGSETTSFYLNNISKAFRYTMESLQKDSSLITERNYMLLNIAYSLAEGKNLIKERTRSALEKVVEKTSDSKYMKSLEEVSELVRAATPNQMKFITAATLDISKSYVENAETIFEMDIKSNITNIANIAIAKAL
ncbi:MAG: VIT and VWA domain-containing protein [Youngiibacter sp.]|nr:VIT and VWA domain-containing protein [Youngiibacter sp.]